MYLFGIVRLLLYAYMYIHIYRSVDTTGFLQGGNAYLEFNTRGEVVPPTQVLQARHFDRFVNWLQDRSQGRYLSILPCFFLSVSYFVSYR